jgi:hypothetical protein
VTTPEDVDRLLNAEESDVLERKASLSDKDGIRDTIIAFANDITNRGGGKIIVGQGPAKNIVGLAVGADEAQRIVSDIARNRVYPAVYIALEAFERDTKTFLIITVPPSTGRPHFRGACYIRQGSTNRIATDAETMALRVTLADEKFRQLFTWFQLGQTRVTCDRLPSGMWGRIAGVLMEVTPTYATIDEGGPQFIRSVALTELQLGYDHQAKRPLVRYRAE